MIVDLPYYVLFCLWNYNFIWKKHAIAYTTSSDQVYGAKATINVWDPLVQELNEFSLSQIWVLSGSFDGSDLNSIEAGWQVHFFLSINFDSHFYISS